MIAGIRILFLSLSVALTQAIYPTIPRLYNLFEAAANQEFLTQDFIYEIWNNIYVLVGVVVLFAIAIKLISAMVNPDNLTDSKKGAKGTYFRAVAAVLLIFLCPMAFKLAYDVQTDLIKDNYLISHIFGFKYNSNDIGQALAWETFSSFCTPVDLDGEELEEAEASGYYDEYYSVQEDIDNINYLDFELVVSKALAVALNPVKVISPTNPIADAANNGILDQDFGFEYHSILCPLAGLLVAYEMLLLVMDTIFRSAKIAILELMLPIVLGAFVFNPEILKKWAKEFFSTYIIVFLKLIAIGFMIIAIVELKARGVIF